MRLEELPDEGQLLPTLTGLLVCILDSRENVNRAVAALNETGIPNQDLILLHGNDGINLVKRVESVTSYFSDTPNNLFNRDKLALEDGCYALGIKVGNFNRARDVADRVRPLGAHGFIHFGLFTDTEFN